MICNVILVFLDNLKPKIFFLDQPSGKYWSPGRPEDLPSLTSPGRPLKILFDRPGEVPIWRPGDVAV